LTARVSPSDTFDANARVEYDVTGNGLQIFSTGTTARLSPPATGAQQRSLSANVTYSQARYLRRQEADRYLSLSTAGTWLANRVGANYSLSWNISQGYVQSQSIMASYMAQCCGVQADFQIYDLPAGYPVSADRRFNFAFVLAGLGTFSNFFGAFGQR
jgi:hypothetical protein